MSSASAPPEEWRVAWPTLGDLIDAWILQHFRVPDGFHRGEPFRESDWQFWNTANFYRVRADARWIPEEPLKNQAFVYRRGQVIAPQKTGKGPWSAAIVAAEACGPTLFGGWAEDGELYLCEEHGCPCGWSYRYVPGEPKGIRQPSPLIQCTATSEDQVANVWRPLTAAIKLGPLGELLRTREGFIRVAGLSDDEDLDRIDAVTSSATSRVGNPISFALQDESGLYTKSNKMHAVAEAQRRGLAGMGGRSLETSNAYNPAEDSTAQRTREATSADVWKFYREPPPHLSYGDQRQRHQIHRYVYFGSPWVDLNSIEAEAEELRQVDPVQAERFFGNRCKAGSGSWLPDGAIAARTVQRELPEPRTAICLGFDGSDVDDWTALRAETFDGQQFTPLDAHGRPCLWNPKEQPEGRIPRADVRAAIEHVFDTFDVVRFYYDPPDWESEGSEWQGKYGEGVAEWHTYRVGAMCGALERFRTDLVKGTGLWLLQPDSADDRAGTHFRNAIIRPRPGRVVTSEGRQLQPYILGKPSQPQKIDAAMAGVLAHEAVQDAIAGGDLAKRKKPAISTTFYGFA